MSKVTILPEKQNTTEDDTLMLTDVCPNAIYRLMEFACRCGTVLVHGVSSQVHAILATVGIKSLL